MRWIGTVVVVLLLAAPIFAALQLGVINSRLTDPGSRYLLVIGAAYVVAAFVVAMVIQALWTFVWRKRRQKGSYHRRVNWTALGVGCAFYAFNLFVAPYLTTVSKIGQ